MEVFLYTARIKCSLLLQTRDGESCIFPRMVSKLSQFNTVVYRLVPNEQNFTCTCTVGTQCLGSNRWRNWVILGLCKYLAMVQLAAPYWRHTERQEIASSVCSQLCCELVSWRKLHYAKKLETDRQMCTPQQDIAWQLWNALRSVIDQRTNIYHPSPASRFSNRECQKLCMSVMPGSEGCTHSSCSCSLKCTAKFNPQNNLLLTFLHWFFFFPHSVDVFWMHPAVFHIALQASVTLSVQKGSIFKYFQNHTSEFCSSPIISHILLSIFLPSIYFMMYWNDLSYIKNDFFFTSLFIRLESPLGRYQTLSKPDNFSLFMRTWADNSKSFISVVTTDWMLKFQQLLPILTTHFWFSFISGENNRLEFIPIQLLYRNTD